MAPISPIPAPPMPPIPAPIPPIPAPIPPIPGIPAPIPAIPPKPDSEGLGPNPGVCTPYICGVGGNGLRSIPGGYPPG